MPFHAKLWLLRMAAKRKNLKVLILQNGKGKSLDISHKA
jgi:hypothetical protein